MESLHTCVLRGAWWEYASGFSHDALSPTYLGHTGYAGTQEREALTWFKRLDLGTGHLMGRA